MAAASGRRPAFSPRTHDFYVMGVHEPASYTTVEVKPYQPGTPVAGQVMGGRHAISSWTERTTHGSCPARSPPSMSIPARSPGNTNRSLPMFGGVLATASDLVFAGEMDGHFDAFDARTGKKLWSFNLGVGVCAPPITYRVKGVQYVAVAAGGLSANAWPRLMATLGRPQFGDVIAIFAVADRAGH